MFHKCYTPIHFFCFFCAGVAGRPGFLVLKIQILRRWPEIPRNKNIFCFPYIKIVSDASGLQVCEEFWPGNCFNLLQFCDHLKHCFDHDQGVEKVVNGTFAFLNSEGALRWVKLASCANKQNESLLRSVGPELSSKGVSVPSNIKPEYLKICVPLVQFFWTQNPIVASYFFTRLILANIKAACHHARYQIAAKYTDLKEESSLHIAKECLISFRFQYLIKKIMSHDTFDSKNISESVWLYL